MEQPSENIQSGEKVSCREFLAGSTSLTAVPPLAIQETPSTEARRMRGMGRTQPNLLMIIADQVRWDVVGATLVEATGIPVPETMQGRSAYRLLDGKVEGWRNEVFIMISESMIGRGIRTDQWTYAIAAPNAKPPGSKFSSDHYVERQLYDLFSYPHQLVNLAGRREYQYQEVASQLREHLKARMAEAGDQSAEIEPAKFYP